jgi:outer membrane protein
MKTLLRLLTLGCALLAAAAAAQSPKIGYVNGLRVENESAMTKRFVEQIQKDFAPRERALKELQETGTALEKELESRGGAMPPAERQAKQKRLVELVQQFEQMRRAYAEDIEARRREARAALFQRVNAIIKVIAEAEQYDLIVQQAVYGTAQIDITQRVLAELAKESETGGK